MRYRIQHQTRLEFPSPVNEHQCEIRLTPRDDENQHVVRVEIQVEPAAELFEYRDAFGNRVHHFSVVEPHDRLVTRIEIDVESDLANPFGYPLMSPDSERRWYDDWMALHPNVLQYVLHQSPETPRLSPVDFASAEAPPPWDRTKSVQNSLMAVMDWVGTHLDYRPGTTAVHAPLSQILRQRSGVCQDFAHLMIAAVRSMGLPARYVMGYLSPCFVDAASSENQYSHAWAEVLVPGAGWRGFDPTHGLVANDSYIAVAVGRDSEDAAPQRGSFKGSGAGREPDIKLVVSQQSQ